MSGKIAEEEDGGVRWRGKEEWPVERKRVKEGKEGKGEEGKKGKEEWRKVRVSEDV